MLSLLGGNLEITIKMLNAFDLAILLPGIHLTVIAVQYCLQQQKTENNLNPLTGNLMSKL